MKLLIYWLVCILGIALASCGYHDDAETSFANQDLQPQPPERDTEAKSHYYAKYRFTADGKYDVDAALRIGVDDRGIVTQIEVKDLSPGREDSAIEYLDNINYRAPQGHRILFNQGKVIPHNDRTEFGFAAKTSGQGDTYFGIHSVPRCTTDNSCKAKASDPTWQCCGKMYFVSNPTNIRIWPNTPLDTYVGTKIDLEGLDETWWKETNGICEHKLEFVNTPNEVSVGTEFNLKANILDCEDQPALVFKGQAHISRRFKDHGMFYMSRDKNLHFGKGMIEFTRNINPTLYGLLQEQGHGKVVQYRVTTTINDEEISAASPKIRITPPS